MSLLNKILSFFGLNEKTSVTNNQQMVEPKIIINPIVESQETPVEVEIKVEEKPISVKPKTSLRNRPKSSTTKSVGDNKKPAIARKPRAPRKPKEE